MRLFLYLVALLAGYSPAEAVRAAASAPVAVASARLTQGAVAAQNRVAAVAARPSNGAFPHPGESIVPVLPQRGQAPILSVYKTDRLLI